jgi:hypothetical protein
MKTIGSAALALTLFSAVHTATANDDERERENRGVRHVLLISVDGLHRQDLAWWVGGHPGSALARLSRHGVTYTAAKAPTPSDSFPGLLALVTGGTPKSTGVYYDDSYDRTLFAPGSECKGDPGAEIVYDESIDKDTNQLFSGGIDPANLPLELTRDGKCKPVFPHQFLKVNTIFEVAKKAGRRTAWSDKHPAYDLVNGPSGKGVGDLYTPEINSLIVNGGTVQGVNLTATLKLCNSKNALPTVKVYTDCIPSVEAYDDVKVQAVINQIQGNRSDGGQGPGGKGPGVPAIFGMNFQAVSVGQKLPVGGYKPDLSPSANLEDAIMHTDASIGRMIDALEDWGLWNETLVIISAKHGQSPIDRSELAMEAGGRGDATVQDPGDLPGLASAFSSGGRLQTDDVGLVWLQDQSKQNVSLAVDSLTDNASLIRATQLPPRTIFHSNIVSGDALTDIYGDPTSGDRVAYARAPNVFIQPDEGVIYSGSSKKIAEHGGGAPGDTEVALLVAGGGVRPGVVRWRVFTTQVAPTILEALGLDPDALEAVRKEHTRVLPGLELRER